MGGEMKNHQRPAPTLQQFPMLTEYASLPDRLEIWPSILPISVHMPLWDVDLHLLPQGAKSVSLPLAAGWAL